MNAFFESTYWLACQALTQNNQEVGLLSNFFKKNPQAQTVVDVAQINQVLTCIRKGEVTLFHGASLLEWVQQHPNDGVQNGIEQLGIRVLVTKADLPYVFNTALEAQRPYLNLNDMSGNYKKMTKAMMITSRGLANPAEIQKYLDTHLCQALTLTDAPGL